MRFSVPVYQLKRRAKQHARERSIPLHQALDEIAVEEGFSSWSLLAARSAADSPTKQLLSELTTGDMVLLGARPGHGKTLLGLELTVEAMQQGRSGVFYSLDYSEADILERFRGIGADPARFNDRFRFDNSDDISAAYIIEQLQQAPAGTVVVIDYLQLLDQKRSNPELGEQVSSLKAFAKQQQLTVIFISQIDRRFDAGNKSLPELADVRLPNPLDLGLFSKTCFLHEGEIQLTGT